MCVCICMHACMCIYNIYIYIYTYNTVIMCMHVFKSWLVFDRVVSVLYVGCKIAKL